MSWIALRLWAGVLWHPAVESDHEGENRGGESFTSEGGSSTRRGYSWETTLEMVRREVMGEIRELVETAVEKKWISRGRDRRLRMELNKEGLNWKWKLLQGRALYV
jgi:hypothetical protein